jgi:tetratricopeptide (TPR) repeat protein
MQNLFSSKLMLFIAFLAFFSCKKNTDNTNVAKAQIGAAIEIPKLLDRSEALRNGKEWDNVQNYYGTQCAALRLNPNDAEAKLKLVECFIREARVTGEHPHYYPAALKMTEEVLQFIENSPEKSPKDKDKQFRALSHKASVQMSLHHFADAKVTSEQAIALNPYNAYIYGCLTDALVELGQYKQAVEVCDKMVSIRPDLRSYARVSYLREIYKDFKGATEAMEMAVQAGFPGTEETEWARLQLGHLHEKYGKLKDASLQYQRCLAERENYPFALAALATVERKQGKLKDAEMHLQKACEIIPEVAFYRELATLYEKMGKKEEAKNLIPTIEKMYAEDMQAGHFVQLELANFYLEQAKNPTKALEFAQQEYAVRPDNIDVNHAMAAIYEELGDKEKVIFHKKKS